MKINSSVAAVAAYEDDDTNDDVVAAFDLLFTILLSNFSGLCVGCFCLILLLKLFELLPEFRINRDTILAKVML